MATIPNSTILPRTVYESPCHRVRVVREGPRDFALFLDDRYTKRYPSAFQAEHDGGLWLHEQSLELAAQLADEAAMSDAAAQPAIPHEGPYIVTEASTRHAMYLDGLIVGFARTREEARRTLRELISEVQQMESVAAADMHADAAQLADEARVPDAASAGVLALDILPPFLAAPCPCLA